LSGGSVDVRTPLYQSSRKVSQKDQGKGFESGIPERTEYYQQ
jgi:hypothetical protein